MVNLKKIERMKKKREFALKMLGFKDIENVRDIFIYPCTITSSNIQLLLVPFISYNLSYPIESTKFALLHRIESNGFTFHFVGKNAKAPIFFEGTQLNSKEEVKQWAWKKEKFLRKEIQRAYDTVYNDLDGDPNALWYNDIRTIHIPIEVLKNLSHHFTRQIVIITNGTKIDENGEFRISVIELSNITTSQTLVRSSPLYG